MELLAQLKKYYSNNSISDYYFLKYQGYGKYFYIFRYYDALQVHLKQFMNEKDSENTAALIGEMCEETDRAFFSAENEGARHFSAIRWRSML